MNATSTGARAALPKTRLERAWKGSSPRLTESSLRNWVEQARADRTKGRSELTTEEGAELAGLRKDNRELRMERDILEKSEFPIAKLCRYLQVSASGFYAARDRPESAHAQTDRRLRVLVRVSFDESRQRYGSPRIHEDLIAQAEHVSRKRVIRLMQEDGLEARARKRFKGTTMSDHDQPVAANLLARRFEAPGPNQRWVGDTTEFVIAGVASSISRSSSTSSHGSWWAGRSVP